MNNFHVGQKVTRICESAWSFEKYGVPCPKYGSVYTVRDVEMGMLDDGTEVVAIRVQEIVNPLFRFRSGVIAEPNFDARQFRPVIERKTDISIFTRMLAPTSGPLIEVE